MQLGIPSWLLIPVCSIISHFGCYKGIERIRIGPLLAALGLYRVGEIDWTSCGGLDDFLSFDFATGTIQGFRAEKTAPVKQQMVDDGPVVPVILPSIHVSRLRGEERKKLSKVERNYRRCLGRVGDDAGQLAVLLANVVDYFVGVFAQQAL